MRRAPLALLAVLALAALQGCGGPLLFAELQVSALRVTLPEQAFPASDTTVPGNWCSAVQTDPPCIQVTLDYDLAAQVPILNEPNATYELRLTDVAIALSATEAGKDLSGVRQVSIRVLADPLDPASGIVVASYVRPPGGGAPTGIGVTGNPNLDLGPYLEAGGLPVRIEVTIDQPTPAFLADVAAGFSLQVQLDYGSLL
jgi:predicted small lipoprotein YifL